MGDILLPLSSLAGANNVGCSRTQIHPHWGKKIVVRQIPVSVAFLLASHPLSSDNILVIQELQLRQPWDRSLHIVFQKVSGKNHPVNPIVSVMVCVLCIMHDTVSKTYATHSLKRRKGR